MRPFLFLALATKSLIALPAFAADPADVVANYADIATASYGYSLATAHALQ